MILRESDPWQSIEHYDSSLVGLSCFIKTEGAIFQGRFLENGDFLLAPTSVPEGKTIFMQQLILEFKIITEWVWED